MSDIKNQIKMMPVKELLGRKFFIPSYQRGYKWTEKQVEDLLNDLNDFKTRLENKENCDEFYCLQPLAVKPDKEAAEKEQVITINKSLMTEDYALKQVKILFNEGIRWRVIDGQQRLTTIYLLLCYLESQEQHYSIEYETRQESKKYLENFSSNNMQDVEEHKNENVDFYHIYKVYEKISEWFKYKNEDYKSNFLTLLKEKVQFIWYETSEDEIEVFTRLNIGKIGLTNSELIKALILSQSNFDERKQNEIANEWNEIEQSLQNEEFWYFIHDKDYNKPTRIDFLFDTLCELYIKEKKRQKIESHKEIIGTDQYRTFRHYDKLFKDAANSNGNINEFENQWNNVRKLFEVLTEWYKDVEYYHYIGFILCDKKSGMIELYQKWNENRVKSDFTDFLKSTIKKILRNVKKQENVEDVLEQQYEKEIQGHNAIPKTVCKPILLLHNIQTVINQNKQAESVDKFKFPVFYRFPFNLYKTQDWDVEHIDSNTTNDLKDNFSKLLWMLQYEKYNEEGSAYNEMYNFVANELFKSSVAEQLIIESEIKSRVKNIVFNNFDKVVAEIESKLVEDALDDNLKNQIGNFTLLDSSTNRGYGNSIFPRKRLVIMAKDRCMSYQLSLKMDADKKFIYEPTTDKSVSAFIPPVTRNVFMKYYSPMTTDFTTWSKADFDNYKSDIREVLKEFLQ